MDGFVLIIHLKYFHLPIINNRLLADTKHAFLSLAVKTVPVQTPFWAQPWEHRAAELKVSCVPALASLFLWSVMHLDASNVYFSHHVASSRRSLEESVAFWAASELPNHLSPSSPCRMRCVPLFWVGGSVKQLLDGTFRCDVCCRYNVE